MISAWKRFINKSTLDNDTSSSDGTQCIMPPGIQKLGKDLQRKFAKGVNYNMKVVIKGDNKVGKTSLMLRLKGYGFDGNYNPTESLNVTSIDWNYKATDDVVKIDLWEAVDSASKKSVNFVDLKLDDGTASNLTVSGQENKANGFQAAQSAPSSKVIVTSTQLVPNGRNNNRDPIPESARQCLNELSETFDVYQGTNAVLLLMDMTKSWTYKYVQNELPRIPRHIPVLVIANHRDQGHHRTISAVQVQSFIDGLGRDPHDGLVMYTETSMKNGFGMRLIEKFFNIPFLRLQEATLVKQLDINRQDSNATLEELQILQESIDREYVQFTELETIRRRQQADAMSPVNSGLRQLDETTREQIRNTNLSSDIIDKTNTNVTSIDSKDLSSPSPQMPAKHFVNDRLPSIVIGAKCPLPEMKQNMRAYDKQQSNEIISDKKDESETSNDSEDEEPRANPLVANYQSDVDSDDQAK